MLPHIQLDIYIMFFQTCWACQRIKWKREGEDHRDSCVKCKTRIKDRHFAEGSRGCHVLLWLDARSLNAKECHFILPLVIGTFIIATRSYKAYFLHTNRSYIFREQFLLLATMTTYLKDLTQSIGRYVGLSWQNWVWGYLEAQVVSLLGAKNLASMREKGKLNMLDDPLQYTLFQI